MATREQVTKFIDTIAPIAAKVCKERGYGNVQAWTCVAQACCESAYGTSNLMRNANAFFGIKANAAWVKAAKYGGKVYNSRTKECYDGKTLTTITDKFRAYNSMEDSVRDYFDLIEMPRYKQALKAESVRGCIQIIKNGGYATAVNYVETIMSFYNKSKDQLAKYTVDGNVPIINKEETPSQKPKTRAVIRLGSKNDDVKYLHSKLRPLGYGVSASSNFFDTVTQQCVMHYQKVNGLSVDGVVGPMTWAKIEAEK